MIFALTDAQSLSSRLITTTTRIIRSTGVLVSMPVNNESYLSRSVCLRVHSKREISYNVIWVPYLNQILSLFYYFSNLRCHQFTLLLEPSARTNSYTNDLIRRIAGRCGYSDEPYGGTHVMDTLLSLRSHCRRAIRMNNQPGPYRLGERRLRHRTLPDR